MAPKTSEIHRLGAQNKVPGIDLIPRTLSDRSWAQFWSMFGRLFEEDRVSSHNHISSIPANKYAFDLQNS